MLAERHDDDELKAIWAALVAGRLTDDEAQAAAEAIQGRRRPRQGIDAAEPPKAALGQRRRRREKLFGVGRPVPLDRNAKVRIMHWARCLARRTEKGRAYGVVTAKALAVLEALLWGFHNAKSGLCFPSYETIAAAADCARSTVYEAIKALEDAGIMSWVHRLKRVRVPCADLFGETTGSRVVPQRTSNGYHFIDPVGSGLRPDLPESEKPTGTANQGFFSSKGVTRQGWFVTSAGRQANEYSPAPTIGLTT
jgi:hypothetical protein